MFPEAFPIILVVFAYGSSLTIEPSLRSFGGQEMPIEIVPYTVSILRHNIHICGGAIIEKQWIITAAHCVEDTDDLQVQAGLANLLRPGRSLQKIEVEEVILHPLYVNSNVSFMNNIALLKLERDFNFNSAVQPINILSSYQLETYINSMEPAVVSGWGSSESADSSVSNRLFSGEVYLSNNEGCQEMFPDCEEFIPDANLCSLAWESKKLAGSLDDGGPLVLREQLGGLIIHGKRNRKGYRPILSEIYGGVPFHANFIKAHIPQLFSENEREFPSLMSKKRDSWKLDLSLLSVPPRHPTDGSTFVFDYDIHLPGSWDVTLPEMMYSRSLPSRCPRKNVVRNAKWVLSIEIVKSNYFRYSLPTESDYNLDVKLAKYVE